MDYSSQEKIGMRIRDILASKRRLTRNGLIEQAIEDFLATPFDEEQEDEN